MLQENELPSSEGENSDPAPDPAYMGHCCMTGRATRARPHWHPHGHRHQRKLSSVGIKKARRREIQIGAL